MNRLFALIPAGGGGSRAGIDVPKQYHPILGRPMLAHTIGRLASALPLAATFVAIAPQDVPITPMDALLRTRPVS